MDRALRMCVFCRNKALVCNLLRVVRLPGGLVTVDDSGKMDGRGAYLCPSESCINGAKKRSSIEKALKTWVPGEIYDNLLKRVRSLHG